MSESWHDYGFGICTSNLKEEISLPGLMELISQAPELKERVNTFMNNECGGAFKDSYDILTSYVEQYGIYDFGGLAEVLYEVIKEVEEICPEIIKKTTGDYTTSHTGTVLAIINIQRKIGPKLKLNLKDWMN